MAPPAPSVAPSKRYYIERGAVRRRPFAGEAAVAEFLRGYGFEAVGMAGRAVVEQAALFASAKAIVAPHGAALTNLIFAPQGTKVIEIFPPNYREASYFTAASHGGLDYYYLIGSETGVDPDKLARLLAQAGITPPAA
jgi:capsular polysaccharide biosynthesis protein